MRGFRFAAWRIERWTRAHGAIVARDSRFPIRGGVPKVKELEGPVVQQVTGQIFDFYCTDKKNDEFQKAYAQIVNTFTAEFSKDFCTKGHIDWQKIVELNSKK